MPLGKTWESAIHFDKEVQIVHRRPGLQSFIPTCLTTRNIHFPFSECRGAESRPSDDLPSVSLWGISVWIYRLRHHHRDLCGPGNRDAGASWRACVAAVPRVHFQVTVDLRGEDELSGGRWENVEKPFVRPFLLFCIA